MSEQPTNETQEAKGTGAMLLHHLITFVLVAGVLALGVWGYLAYKNGKSFFSYEATGPSPIRAYQVKTQVERIELAGQTFYRIHDNHPSSLNELVQEGLLTPKDLQTPDNSVNYKMQIINDVLTVTSDDLATKDYKPKKSQKKTSTPKAKDAKGKRKKPKKSKKP